MKVTAAAETPTRHASPDFFTGAVTQDPIGTTPVDHPVTALKVTFPPGARTHWHTHPQGQTLHVLTGVGLVQKEGEPAWRIRPGDTVWIAPGERHWHGAAPQHQMSHLAMQHLVDGAGVSWAEAVSETDYAAAAEGAQNL
ncbi:MAG: cupin domain-containing protein [Pseudomonadota bacterium]